MRAARGDARGRGYDDNNPGSGPSHGFPNCQMSLPIARATDASSRECRS